MSIVYKYSLRFVEQRTKIQVFFMNMYEQLKTNMAAALLQLDTLSHLLRLPWFIPQKIDLLGDY
jgi:hypothetical protein